MAPSPSMSLEKSVVSTCTHVVNSHNHTTTGMSSQKQCESNLCCRIALLGGHCLSWCGNTNCQAHCSPLTQCCSAPTCNTITHCQEKIKPDFYELQRAEGFGFATLQDVSLLVTTPLTTATSLASLALLWPPHTQLWDKTITSGDAHVRTREMTMPAFRKFMTKSFGAAQGKCAGNGTCNAFTHPLTTSNPSPRAYCHDVRPLHRAGRGW